jgi:hypothetical protein
MQTGRAKGDCQLDPGHPRKAEGPPVREDLTTKAELVSEVLDHRNLKNEPKIASRGKKKKKNTLGSATAVDMPGRHVRLPAT